LTHGFRTSFPARVFEPSGPSSSGQVVSRIRIVGKGVRIARPEVWSSDAPVVISSTHSAEGENTMGHWRLVAGSGLIAALALSWPVSTSAQVRGPDAEQVEKAPSLEFDPARFEFSLGTYVGRPGGYIRVGENGDRGRRLRLNDDLNIGLSEAVDASVAFHLTPRDAIRATFLYYFLRGRGFINRESVTYNGEEFKVPSHVSIDADFYRIGLAYERTASIPGGFLTGIVGLTYVHLNPKLSSNGQSNSEDFSRQELPVPIVGLRFDIPMGNGFAARAAIGGGGLPRVNSGRKESGSTVYLEQIHGDASMALTYAITKNLVFDIGPRLTYFFQHEKSHQEDNAFQLIDYGLRAGVTLKF
jgi:hypothetical protein